MKKADKGAGCAVLITFQIFLVLVLFFNDPTPGVFIIIVFLMGILCVSLSNENNKREEEQDESGDFMNVLLILSASIIKLDNKVYPSEINYVRNFFRAQFGEEKMDEYIVSLHQILEKDYDLQTVCVESRERMPMSYRLQLLHYLFGLAHIDGSIDVEENTKIYTIAGYLQISSTDYYSIKAMYEEKRSYKNSTTSYIADINYTILGITNNATNAEVKDAYRKMAVKYHPDKVTHLGEDIQRTATEKFQRINAAYKQIKKERGMK